MEKKTENQKPVNEGMLLRILDTLYDKAQTGIPQISSSVTELAAQYMEGKDDPEKAARAMQRSQITKCTAAGLITGIGGIITLPVSIPANVSGVMYMQLRMISCTAKMAGFDPSDPTVRAYSYACFAGVSVRTPEQDLGSLREKAAARLLARAGEKGVLHLAKLIPVIGAGVNGALDLTATRTIADRAFRMFFQKDYDMEDEQSLYRRGTDLYRRLRGKDLDEDIRDFADKAKNRMQRFREEAKDRFTQKETAQAEDQTE
ncbi:MAG: EcsC family protein, partial [Eubacterium sp.]|nr:EcsC family protein [Eubacterium sp.]